MRLLVEILDLKHYFRALNTIFEPFKTINNGIAVKEIRISAFRMALQGKAVV